MYKSVNVHNIYLIISIPNFNCLKIRFLKEISELLFIEFSCQNVPSLENVDT